MAPQYRQLLHVLPSVVVGGLRNALHPIYCQSDTFIDTGFVQTLAEVAIK